MSRPSFDKVTEAICSVGWFIPPYVSVAFIDSVGQAVDRAQGRFTQEDLEKVLTFVYGADRLASMVVSQYSNTPVVKLYVETISEAISAHFSGLRHVAVGGLIPVIEGAGRQLARERGMNGDSPIKEVFRSLAAEAREDVVTRKIGATQEIVNMVDGFLHFIESYFYTKSQAYPLIDKTNRHGIAHGAYTDGDYGKPINFYKTIAAVDFLTFLASLKTKKMSGFAPDHTPESQALAARYLSLSQLA